MNFLKRVLALTLVLVMVIGYVPASVFAAENEERCFACPHCNNVHVDTWTAWDGTTALSTAGHYYLKPASGDTATMAGSITISKDIVIDLNGYTLQAADGQRAFGVSTNGKLTILDTSADETGRILGSGTPVAANGGLIYVEKTSSRFYLYSGTITGGKISGSKVNGGNIHVANGKAYFYGGKVTEGYSTYRGGNITGYSDTAFIYLLGDVEVSGGTAGNWGGNIYITNHTKLYIADNAVMTDGTATSGGNIRSMKGYIYILGGTVQGSNTTDIVGGSGTTYDTHIYLYGGTVGTMELAGSASEIQVYGGQTKSNPANWIGSCTSASFTTPTQNGTAYYKINHTTLNLTAPSCTTGGSAVYACATCNHSYTQALEAIGHTYTIGTNRDCGNAGHETYTCACGEYHECGTLLPATGDHNYVFNAERAEYVCNVCQNAVAAETCDGCGEQVLWTEWSGETEITEPGHYRLTKSTDLREAITVAEGTSLCIDLAGHVLQAKNGDNSFVNYGNLYIVDTTATGNENDGTYTAGSIVGNEYRILSNQASGTFTLVDGILTGGVMSGEGRGGNIYTNGVVNIEGGMVTNGQAHRGGNINVNGGTLNLRGGVVSGGTAASRGGNINSLNTSEVNIYEGAVVKNGNASGSEICATGNKAVVNLRGGTVSSNKSSGMAIYALYAVVNIFSGNLNAANCAAFELYYGSGHGVPVLNIYGGEVTGTVKGDTDGCAIAIYGGTVKGTVSAISEGDCVIYNGSFSKDPSAYVADCSAYCVKDGLYKVWHGACDNADHAAALELADTLNAQIEHDYSDATCTQAPACENCGQAQPGGTVVEHSWVENTDSKYLKNEATCTAAAVYYKSCSACGGQGTETFESGNALGHNYGETGVCTRCDELAAAKVTKGEEVTHYADVMDALVAANGTGATVTVLKSVTVVMKDSFGTKETALTNVTIATAEDVTLTDKSGTASASWYMSGVTFDKDSSFVLAGHLHFAGASVNNIYGRVQAYAVSIEGDSTLNVYGNEGAYFTNSHDVVLRTDAASGSVLNIYGKKESTEPVFVANTSNTNKFALVSYTGTINIENAIVECGVLALRKDQDKNSQGEYKCPAKPAIVATNSTIRARHEVGGSTTSGDNTLMIKEDSNGIVLNNSTLELAGTMEVAANAIKLSDGSTVKTTTAEQQNAGVVAAEGVVGCVYYAEGAYTVGKHTYDAQGECTNCDESVVAKVINGEEVTYYKDFAAALAYANGKGYTVTALSDVTITIAKDYPIEAPLTNVTIDCREGVTITENTKNGTANLYVANVVFAENAHFVTSTKLYIKPATTGTLTEIKGHLKTYIYNQSENAVVHVTGTVETTGSAFVMDYTIDEDALLVDGGTFKVSAKKYFAVHSGNVKFINGATFVCSDFRIDDLYDPNGTNPIPGRTMANVVFEDMASLELVATMTSGPSLTAPAGIAVTTEDEGCCVWYTDGTYTVKAHEAPAATCTADGKCSNCDVVVNEATGHDWEETYSYTLSEDKTEGTVRFDCKNCDHYEEVKGSVTVTLKEASASCQVNGWNTYSTTVTFNENTYTATKDVQDAAVGAHNFTGTNGACVNEGCSATACGTNGHTEVDDAPKAPTCTETGLTAGKHCSVCGTVTVEQTVVPATGHDVEGVLPVRENEKPATCTVDGSYDLVKYCKTCSKEAGRTTVTVTATGHSYTAPTFVWADDFTCVVNYGCANCTETFEAACAVTNDGAVASCKEEVIKTYTATVTIGEETYTDDKTETLAKKPHTEATKEEVITEATCGVAGSKKVTTYCSVCETEIKTETAEIPALNHSYDGTYTCVNCGKTKCEVEGHTLQHFEAIPANCTNSGQVEYWLCMVCNLKFADKDATTILDRVTIDPNGEHTWGEWKSNDDGTHTRVCTINTNHTEDGTCDTTQGACPVCGYEAPVVVTYVAEVNGEQYETLQAAIDAANGATVKLIADIDLGNANVKVLAGTSVTLDLNGYTISGTCGGSEAYLIQVANTADLIIEDNSAEADGKITYASGTSKVGFVFDVKGDLVLNSGTIEMTGPWSIGFAVDVRPNAWGSAYTEGTSFTMNGGKIVSSDGAVRVDSNSSNVYEPLGVTFTMNGGEIDAVYDAIFVQHRYANDLYVKVNGGTLSSDFAPIRIYGDVVSNVDIAITGGTFNYTGAAGGSGWIVENVLKGTAANVAAADIAISGGSFDGDVTDYCVDGYKAEMDAETGKYGIVEAKTYVAEVNGTPYETLAEAFANANGATVKLLTDVELEAVVTVTSGANITLDLAGCKLTRTIADNANGANVINNEGTLTITDTVGEGEICLTYTGERNSNVSFSTIRNYGVLNVESGTVNCVSGNQAISYAIDNFRTINMTGGAVIGGASNYSIRMFLASTTDDNVLNVSGGTVYYVWAQNTNANANKATINITDGTVYYVYIAAANGVACDVSNISVNAKIASMPYGVAVVSNDGTYSIQEIDGFFKLVKEEEKTYVAEVNGTPYETLAEAFANANGATVKLIADIETTETITIPADAAVTLDLNGHKIVATDNKAANVNYELFYIYGEMTVIGDGAIELTSTSNDTAWAKSSSIFHNRGGVLTIESGSFTHKGGTAMAYVVDNSANSYGDATTTINGGTLTSAYIGIRNRMDTYGANGGGNGVAKLAITGGEITGKYAVWGQVSSAGVKGEIAISGGKLTGAEGKEALRVGTDATGEIKTAVSGGTFSSAVPAEYCAEGFEPKDNGDGTYGVQVEQTIPMPELPTATTKDIVNEDLTFAMNFKADEATAEQLAYFGKWFADFELKVNKPVTFDANGTGDGWLSGQYDEWSENWVNVPFKAPVSLAANEVVKIMATAAAQMGEPGLKYTYQEVYDVVKDFDCGVFFTPEFLAANPDLVVTLELRIYNPANEAESYKIGETYVFANEYVAYNVQTGKLYTQVSTATIEAAAGQTVRLLRNASDVVVNILNDVTLDLDGFTLDVAYMFSFGHIVDDSEANTGRLAVGQILMNEANKQMPIKDAAGAYGFYEILGFNTATRTESFGNTTVPAGGLAYAFQVKFEAAAVEAMLAGKDVTKTDIVVRVSWTRADGTTAVQDFVYVDERVLNVMNSYVPTSGGFKQMFTLVLSDVDSYEDLSYHVCVVSDTKVESAAAVTEAPVVSVTTQQEQNLSHDNGSSAVVPEGTKVQAGKELSLNIENIETSNTNITLHENEEQKSVDVHVEGVAVGNTVPVIVTLKDLAEPGLNSGNLTLYHVENGTTNTMTQVASLAEVDAHNEFFYEPATGDITMALVSFSEVAVVSETDAAWKGNFDYNWYTNHTGEGPYVIANADQLAAFGAIVGGMNGQTQNSFSGKTVKLIADINLGDVEEKNNPDIIFYPIGYNSSDGKYEKTNVAVTTGFYSFMGTFDGNGHTVSNFYQNTWEMKGDHNWYTPEEQYYRDGMGLFGRVYKGAVKNLTVRNFSSDGEIATTGVIAAYAEGATFENIAIFNCNPRVYNIGNGGIVGCVGWYAKDADLKTTFKNITVDNSNKISALWGSYDVACGGIVGQYYPTSGQSSANYPANAGIHFENCHISAQMDVYNDVCANYQYYAYRYTGMLIGSVRENVTIDGHVYPKMDGITAKDCTVHFGTWNDYYYCEIIDNTTASYTHDYQMSRLTEIKAIDGTTITYLDGTTGTVPASGRANYVIVDYTKGHGTENATCYHFKDGAVWTHEMGGIQTGIDENGDGQDDLKEDKQHIYLEFNNLVTGYGWGVTSKGVDDLAGVDILDRKEGTSVEKFEGKVTELANNKAYKLSDIFNFVDNGVELVPGAVTVAVTNLDEKNPVSATIVYDKENWENGTITFTGTGMVKLTIQDYYFCTPTTITVNITERQSMDKFTAVGNSNANAGTTVTFGDLFAVIGGVEINETVTVEVNGTDVYTGSEWQTQTYKFEEEGVYTFAITDNDIYCNTASTEVTVSLFDAFAIKFTKTDKFLYRVGNKNNITLSSLFESKDTTADVGAVTVTVEKAEENYTYTSNATWYKGTLRFKEGFTGPVKVTIKGKYTNSVSLNLEVVTATNHETTNAPGVTGGSVVLLNDVSGSFSVSGGHTLYGNDFTVTLPNTVQSKFSAGYTGYVTMSGGNLDNVRIEGPVYPQINIFREQAKDSSDETKANYFINSILINGGNNTISNSYISGSRTAICIRGGNNVIIEDTTVFGGAVANIHIASALSVTLRNLTTHQEDQLDSYTGTNTVHGMGVYVETGTTEIRIEGTLNQYNWVNKTQWNAMVPAGYQSSFPYFFDNDAYKQFQHNRNGVVYVNLGFIFGCDWDSSNLIQDQSTYAIKDGISLGGHVGGVYTTANQGTVTDAMYEPQEEYTSSGYNPVKPTLHFDIQEDADDPDNATDTYCVYDDATGILKIGITGTSTTVDLSDVKITKAGTTLVHTTYLNGTQIANNVVTVDKANGNAQKLILKASSNDVGYDAEGNSVAGSIDYEWTVKIELVTLGFAKPEFTMAGISGNTLTMNAKDSNCVWVSYNALADENYVEAVPIFNGITVKYFDATGEHNVDFSRVTPTQADGISTNSIIYAANGYTLTVTCVQDTWKGKPANYCGVSYNSMYYVYPQGLDNDNVAMDTSKDFTVSFKYQFTSPDGPSTDILTVTWKTTDPTTTVQWKKFDSNNGKNDGCFTPDTLVTLADGTQKRVDELTFDDKILAWDFFTGTYVEKEISLLVNHGEALYEVANLQFSDGTVLRTIAEHGVFDYDLNKYVYITVENMQDYVGHRFVQYAADGGYNVVSLVEAYKTEEYTSAWSVSSAGTSNAFASGLLTVAPPEDFYNWIEMGDTLTYNVEQFKKDVETYGLYTYEDFKDYVTYEQFVAWNGAYLKIPVEKGYFTFEYILELIELYKGWMPNK